MSVAAPTRIEIGVDRRAARRTRRRDRLALTVPALIAAVVPFGWFPSSRFLAAGDVIPFLREGVTQELTAYWNHRVSGTGGTSPASGRLLEVIVLRVVELFGGTEMLAQHFFYAALMAFAAFGAAYLARAFVEHPLAVCAAGLLGAFNPFVLVRLPNPLFLLWLGLVAVLAGKLVRVARGAPCSVIWFAALTLPASYLSLNPPLLVMAIVSVLAVMLGCSLLVGPGGTRRAGKFLARSTPWALTLNAWWALPFVMSTIAREGVNVTAQTRVEDWSWSHAQNSLPNLIALTADWSWKYPEFSPYARALDTAPLSWLRWILPMLALAAPFLMRGRRRVAAVTLVGTGVVGVFLAKGLHAPLTSVNLWLYHHVPGMWLLREPASKAGGIVLLVEVVLAAMTVAALVETIARRRTLRRVSALAVVCAAVAVALAFPLPLWTGAFGSDGKHGLPTDEVAFPREWRALARTVNDSPVRGKLLELPLDPYYQVTTTWGYHGADETTKNLVQRPVLKLLPDGYFTPAGDVAEMLRATERALVHGDARRARNLLRMLGVSHVVVRHDLAPSRVLRPVADPERIGEGLAALGDAGKPQRFGVADLYTIDGGADLAWTPRTITGLVRRDAKRRVDALADLPPDAVGVAPGTVPIDRLSWELPDTSSTVRFSLRRSDTYAIGLRDEHPARWSGRVRSDAGGSRLELVDPVRLRLDGGPVPGAPPITIPLTGTNVEMIKVGSRYFALDNARALPIDGATPIEVLGRAAPPARDITHVSADACGAGALHSSTTPISRGIEIHAERGLACAKVASPALSPDGLYRIQLHVRNVKGATTQLICLSERGPNRCAALDQPIAGIGWSTYDMAVSTDPGVTELTLYLYADGSTGRDATVQFRDVSVTPLVNVGNATVTPTARTIANRHLEAGDHVLRVVQPRAGTSLRATSPLGDCDRADRRTFDQVGLAIHSIPNGVELAADHHAACVSVPIPNAHTDRTYTLALDVRTFSGSRARICVWQDGPNECATTRSLPGNSDWAHYVTNFQLDPATIRARIYLYADGNEIARTLVQYRDLELRDVAPEIVEIHHKGTQPPVPHASWRQSGPDTLEVQMPRSSTPRLLVVDEAYASGWGLSGATANSHTTANGYANAWLVSAQGGERIDVGYGPSKWAHLALPVSLLAALAAVAVYLVRRFRRRHTVVPPLFDEE